MEHLEKSAIKGDNKLVGSWLKVLLYRRSIGHKLILRAVSKSGHDLEYQTNEDDHALEELPAILTSRI